MKKKLQAFLLSLACIVFTIWLTSLCVVSKYASVTIQNIVSQCNLFLAHKYESEAFLYRVSLSYIQTKKNVFSQSGYIKVNFGTQSKEYKIPVEVSYGFFTFDTNFDYYPVFKEFFIKNGLFSIDSLAKGNLHIRLLPFSLTYQSDIKGVYSTLIKREGVVKKDIDGYVPFRFSSMISKDFLGNASVALDIKNLFLPGFSADKVYVETNYYDEDYYQLPKDGRILAKGLIVEGDLQSKLSGFDISLKRNKFLPNKNFDIVLDGLFSTHTGNGNFSGTIQSLNADVIATKTRTWPEVLLEPNLVNTYIKDEALHFVLNEFKYSASLQSKYGPVYYKANAKGHLDLPYTKRGIVSSLSDAQGQFEVNLVGKNILGDEFIKQVGKKMLVEKSDSYSVTIDVANGKLKLNKKVF